MLNLFKKKNNPAFNMRHPELKDKVEFAFKSGSISYYQFVDEYQIRTGRYKWILAYLKEHDLRIEPQAIEKYCDEMESFLNKGEVGRAFHTIEKLRGRAKLAFLPDTIKRLASVIYFDESEDLSDYSMDYGAKKIKNWDKNGTLSFFLMKPIQELLGMNGLSETDLLNYMMSLNMMKDLAPLEDQKTFDTPIQS